ncbi:MAG: lipid-A-disaccharide synthase [Pseudomonadales bacterium]
MKTGLRVGLLAGEASGDNLGAGLMHRLKELHPDIEFIGVGGERMQAAGLNVLLELNELSVNGFRDPIVKLPTLIRHYRNLVQAFSTADLDAFLGIDFNVFNFLVEGALKKRGVKTAHYVSPSVYAWRRGRTRRVAKVADMILCLFPFEPAFYADTNVEAVFVGHPLADSIELDSGSDNARRAARQALGIAESDVVLALLPGSRSSEVQLMLPEFLGAAAHFSDHCRSVAEACQVVIPCVRPELRSMIEAALPGYPGLACLTYDGVATEALKACDVALVKSGTSTLETMLLHRPMVVSYRLGNLSYQLARRLLKSPFVALPNILAGRELVPELLQHAATAEALAQALIKERVASGAPDYFAPFIALHEQLRGQADLTAAKAMLRLMGVGDR